MTFPKPEVITAIATVVYVVISAFLWRATKRTADLTQAMLEASHRPFLGVSLDWNTAGSVSPNGLLLLMRVNFTIKNYGPGSAKQVTGKLSVIRNGKEWSKLIPTIYLPPSQSESFDLEFSGLELPRSEKLDVIADFHYQGFHDKKYGYYEKVQHDPTGRPAKEIIEIRVS